MSSSIVDATKITSPSSTITLNSGHSMPVLGLGFFNANDESTALYALKDAGYRHVDSAIFYGNEELMGRAAIKSGIPRSELFLTTKAMSSHYSKASCLSVVESSLKTAGLDYFDLYLLHDPNGGSKARVQAWKDLETAVSQGKAKSIGVSNFGIHHLEELKNAAGVKTVPAINQIEIHPWCQQKEIVEYCKKEGIVLQAYCPLVRVRKHSDPTLLKISQREGKTPSQVLIRWSLQNGYVPLPKSGNPGRIVENADIFSWSLSSQSMAELDSLDQGPKGACSWNPVDAR